MSEETDCEACAGTGFKLYSRRDLMVTFDMGTNCPECDGTGELERASMPTAALSAELAPCPFCGSDTHEECYSDMYQVACHKCKSSTGLYTSIADAITAWNRRSPTPKETTNG